MFFTFQISSKTLIKKSFYFLKDTGSYNYTLPQVISTYATYTENEGHTIRSDWV